MKRKTNTLGAEYKRLGLIRPNQIARQIGVSTKTIPHEEEFILADIARFDWKGTRVWGVHA